MDRAPEQEPAGSIGVWHLAEWPISEGAAGTLVCWCGLIFLSSGIGAPREYIVGSMLAYLFGTAFLNCWLGLIAVVVSAAALSALSLLITLPRIVRHARDEWCGGGESRPWSLLASTARIGAAAYFLVLLVSDALGHLADAHALLPPGSAWMALEALLSAACLFGVLEACNHLATSPQRGRTRYLAVALAVIATITYARLSEWLGIAGGMPPTGASEEEAVAVAATGGAELSAAGAQSVALEAAQSAMAVAQSAVVEAGQAAEAAMEAVAEGFEWAGGATSALHEAGASAGPSSGVASAYRLLLDSLALHVPLALHCLRHGEALPLEGRLEGVGVMVAALAVLRGVLCLACTIDLAEDLRDRTTAELACMGVALRVVCELATNWGGGHQLRSHQLLSGHQPSRSARLTEGRVRSSGGIGALINGAVLEMAALAPLYVSALSAASQLSLDGFVAVRGLGWNHRRHHSLSETV